jgi:hypothetical protein
MNMVGSIVAYFDVTATADRLGDGCLMERNS